MTISNTSDQASNGNRQDPLDKAREQAADASESIRHEASAVAEQAKQAGKAHAEQQFEKGKALADEQLDSLSTAVDNAAQGLQDDGHPLASYATELSTQVTNLSNSIQDSSLDEIASKAYRLARENPGVFAMGSVALGIVVSRFVIASDSRRQQERAGYPSSSASLRSRSDSVGSDGGARSTLSGSAVAQSSQDSTPGTASSAPQIGRPVSDRSDIDHSTLNRTI